MDDVIETTVTTFLKPDLKRGMETYEDYLRGQFESNIRFGLAGVKGMVTDNPKITELQEYARGVDEKLRYLETRTGMIPAEAELLISRIPREDRKAGFDSLILALQNETGYLQELEDVGISSALLAGLENGKYGAMVKFIAPDSMYAKSMAKRGALAGYQAFLDIVIIPERPPEPEKIWLMLATEGVLPDIVAKLDHELTHDAQWSKILRTELIALASAQTVSYFVILEKYGLLAALGISNAIGVVSRRLLKNIDTDTMLSETHAYEATASSPTTNDKELDENKEIAAHVIDNYETPGRNVYDAMSAYDTIHSLRLLGLDDKELGHLVGTARFDPESKTYPVLEKALTEQRKAWGLEHEPTFERVLDALLSKHDLELRVQRHKAQEIAARELRRETGSWLGVKSIE